MKIDLGKIVDIEFKPSMIKGDGDKTLVESINMFILFENLQKQVGSEIDRQMAKSIIHKLTSLFEVYEEM